MTVLASTVAVILAKVLALGGIVLFFTPRLSAIRRLISLWTRVHVSRPRQLDSGPETLAGQ